MLEDCHIHMVLDGENWKTAIDRHKNSPDEKWIRQQLAAYRAAGFTYLRDGGDRWGVGAVARSLAGEYGITYVTPLAPLCKAGHYGAFIGRTFTTLEEYRNLVAQQKSEGADFIKIMISGLMDFNQPDILSEEGLDSITIRQLIEIAHQAGLPIMAHANGSRVVLAAASAGADSVEHGAYLDESALWAMVHAGTVWVPTLSTIGNLRGRKRYSEEAVEKILQGAMQNVRTFAGMGGLIAPGTDAGAWSVPHAGLTEYRLMSETLGVNAEQILQRGIAAIRDKFASITSKSSQQQDISIS